MSIPNELLEAAEVDGLNKFGIYLKISSCEKHYSTQ